MGENTEAVQGGWGGLRCGDGDDVGMLLRFGDEGGGIMRRRHWMKRRLGEIERFEALEGGRAVSVAETEEQLRRREG